MVDFDEIEVEDGENYKGGDVPSITLIAMEQYRRCMIEGSKEMSRGGQVNKFHKGQMIAVDIPDQREVFINCVKMLEILLIPEIIKKDKIQQLLKENNVEIVKLKNNANVVKKKYERRPSIKLNMEKLDEEYAPEMVNNFRIRLGVLGMLLSDLNYFQESSGKSV